MALPHPNLLPILALFLSMLAKNYVHSQNTSFTYPYFQQDAKNLTLQGDAHILFGVPAVSLTKISDPPTVVRIMHSVGRVVYSPPVQLWEPGRQSSFETNIVFIIRPVNDYPCCGFAFFIAPVGTTIPRYSSGEDLGIFESQPSGNPDPPIFAVEFNVLSRLIRININSRSSVNETKFENGLKESVLLSIYYDAKSRTINVWAAVGSRDYEVSYVHDLKTVLPQRVQVGISAATGDRIALHELQGWEFNSSLESDGEKIDDEHNENEGTYIRQYV